ncbi:MAG TPA: hypothetical protein VNU71_13505 [Burkholderiaceae bacterium]|nr:hypothetical protein [Burkholderiaceae bacterium]
MAQVQSVQIVAGYPAPSPDDAYTTVGVTTEYTTPAAGLAIGDIIEMGPIPPGYVPSDLVVHTGALGAGVLLDAGILTGEYATNPTVARTMGSEFFAAPQSAAAAALLRATKSMTPVLPADINVVAAGWGLKVSGAATAGAIKIRATLYLQSAPVGM